MGTLVACDDVETNPVAIRVTAVNVVPQQLQLSVGGTATLTATVVGDAGLEDRGVTWASSNTAVATVDAAGNVRGVAPGQTTIIASSHADPNVKGAAAVVVTAAAVPSVSISSITKNGLPVDINNVQGQVDVTLNVAGNGAPVYGVSLLVQCPNNTAPVEVQRQTFSNGQAPNGPVTLSFNSAAINAAGTGPQFTNGACNIVTRLLNAQGQAIAEVGDVVRPVTFQNVDYVATTIVGNSSVDNLGQTWWGGGDIQVRVTPVLFSGQTAASGIVTLTGTDNVTGAAVSKQATWTGAGTQTVTFPNTTNATSGIANLTIPNATIVATVLTSAGAAVPVTTQASAFRLDEKAPAAGTYTGVNSTTNFWVSGAFAFTTGTGSGYTAGISSPNTAAAPNDFGGVDRVQVIYEAASINSNTQACSSAQTGLTFVTVTTGSSLQSSAVNGITPNGPSYCLRMREVDALGNATTTYIGVFGVDREAPRFVREGASSVADKSIFDIDGVDQVPTDAFPVVGTVADAASRFFAFTLRDTLSGFSATPVRYTITLSNASATGAATCVVGSYSSSTGVCSATASATQVVVLDSTDRTVRIPVRGGSTAEGYFTFTGTFTDFAGNAGTPALPTRTVLIDGTAPTVTRVGLPGTLITGNSTVTFNYDATDNVDLYVSTAAITYPGVATIRSANNVISTPFDGSPLGSVTNQTVAFANFYRSLTNSASVLGTKPNAVGVRVLDAATNASAANTRAIDPQDVASSTFTFGAASVGLQGFGVLTAAGGTTGGTANVSPTCQAGVACTVTVRVIGPTGTFENPFAGVNLYFTDPATGELILLNATPNTTGAQTDNGTNRFYTYTFSIPAPTFPAYPATWTLTPIGFTSSGDAMMGQNLTVTVTNNP